MLVLVMTDVVAEESDAKLTRFDFLLITHYETLTLVTVDNVLDSGPRVVLRRLDLLVEHVSVSAS